MENTKTKKVIVNFFIKKGILLSPELLKKIEQEPNLDKYYQELQKENFSKNKIIKKD